MGRFLSRERACWFGAEAWIFLSIGDAAGTGRATLSKVIGMADSNNHAIPTPDEFSEAVGHLIGAELITATPDEYGLTARGRRLFQKLNSRKRGHITRFLETADEWRKQAPSDAAPVQWAVDPEQFRRAYLAYHRRFWETYRKLKERDGKGGS